MDDQDREPTEHEAVRDALTRDYGRPEPITAYDALVLARYVRPHGLAGKEQPRPDEVHASIYRDRDAADAWLASNRIHHGHPELTRVRLPDGRVVGILDLRPALARAVEMAREAPQI